MIGVYQANAMVKVAELSEISVQEIKEALAEKKVGVGRELYPILCDQPMAPAVNAEESTVRSYASNVIAKVEDALGIKYDEAVKGAVTEYFVLDRKRYGSSIEQIVERSLSVLAMYPGAEKGSFLWFLMETIKRQLMGVYIKDTKFLPELKILIEEIKKTSAAYDLYAAEL